MYLVHTHVPTTCTCTCRYLARWKTSLSNTAWLSSGSLPIRWCNVSNFSSLSVKSVNTHTHINNTTSKLVIKQLQILSVHTHILFQYVCVDYQYNVRAFYLTHQQSWGTRRRALWSTEVLVALWRMCPQQLPLRSRGNHPTHSSQGLENTVLEIWGIHTYIHVWMQQSFKIPSIFWQVLLSIYSIALQRALV